MTCVISLQHVRTYVSDIPLTEISGNYRHKLFPQVIDIANLHGWIGTSHTGGHTGPLFSDSVLLGSPTWSASHIAKQEGQKIDLFRH